MRTNVTWAILGAMILGLTGCGNLKGSNLFFGQNLTVGVSVGASATDQGGELTLGYKERSMAIVPVAVVQADGSIVPIESIAPDENSHPFADSLSVLGQFEVEASGGTSNSVGLGRFFATGLAARNLAEGFACQLARGESDQEGDCLSAE